MAKRKTQVKRKTRVAKILRGRLKATESSVGATTKDVGNASLVPILSDSQSRSEKLLKRGNSQQFVPVVGKTGKPLMPTTNWRADELIKKGKALRRFKAGIFYIKLTDREEGDVQGVAVGIDPGSKREAFTVKSESHAYLNILSDAVTWVKKGIEVRRSMRRGRRHRNTPCRANKSNRSRNPFPPSTKARWQCKLRIVNILCKLFPVNHFVVEDIKAMSRKGCKKWNKSFSPLETGKNWFYDELRKISELDALQGYDTYNLRQGLGLKKRKSKMKESFDTHCVDSWVLANWWIGGHIKPDNQSVFRMIPIQFHRRQLHRLQPRNGIRLRYGSTMSLGLKKGSLIKHPKWGLSYVGGNMNNRLSLHNIDTGEILSRDARLTDTSFLTYNTWRSFSTQNQCNGILGDILKNETHKFKEKTNVQI